MNNQSKLAYSVLLASIASLNNVNYVEGSDKLNFTVDPSVEQQIEIKVRERADFLQRINVQGVRDLVGQKLSLDTVNSIASRVDTRVEDRKTQDPTGLSDDEYRLFKTNFDTHLRYEIIDNWSKFPNFADLWADVIIRQIGIDRMMIGFHGTSAATKTDRSANPLLQDVNIGWLHQIRQKDESSRYLNGVNIGASVSADNGFKNLDAMVMDMVANMIDPWHQENPELVVLCGRSLLAEKHIAEVSDNDKPTERNALQTIITNRLLGGLPTIRVPFFPDNALLVGNLRALSIYYQEGTRRRNIVDNSKRDQVEDYQSVNEGYVVEDFGAFAFADNIATV